MSFKRIIIPFLQHNDLVLITSQVNQWETQIMLNKRYNKSFKRYIMSLNEIIKSKKKT